MSELKQSEILKLENDIPQALYTELMKFIGENELNDISLLSFVAHQVAMHTTDDEILDYAEGVARHTFDHVDGYDPTPMIADYGV